MANFEPDLDLLNEAYPQVARIWAKRVTDHYPGLYPEPIRHIISLEQMRFRFRPDNPKLVLVVESHIRSPDWAEGRWCFKSKGPAIMYNPQFSNTKFWKFLIAAARINIGEGPNRPDHRRHVINELKTRGFWVAHLSIFGLDGIDKLCGSKDFYSPEFVAEVRMLSKKKRQPPFRISQLNGVDEPETIEFDIIEKSYETYSSHTLADTSCPLLAIKGASKDFCMSRPELKDRIIDVDFLPKNKDIFLDIYKEHCLK